MGPGGGDATGFQKPTQRLVFEQPSMPSQARRTDTNPHDTHDVYDKQMQKDSKGLQRTSSIGKAW